MHRIPMQQLCLWNCRTPALASATTGARMPPAAEGADMSEYIYTRFAWLGFLLGFSSSAG